MTTRKTPTTTRRTTKRSAGVIERHIQTILITLITGAIIFAGNYFFTDKGDKAVLVQQLQQLSAQVQELRQDIRSIQSQNTTKEQYNDHEVRIRALERRSENVGRVFKDQK